MIIGDEGKPMSILERISDEPCDVAPFIEYALGHYRAMLAHWTRLPVDDRSESVTFWLAAFIDTLTAIQEKQRREDRTHFFTPQSLDDITRAQGVDPAFDVRRLAGTLPADFTLDLRPVMVALADVLAVIEGMRTALSHEISYHPVTGEYPQRERILQLDAVLERLRATFPEGPQ